MCDKFGCVYNLNFYPLSFCCWIHIYSLRNLTHPIYKSLRKMIDAYTSSTPVGIKLLIYIAIHVALKTRDHSIRLFGESVDGPSR